VEVKRPGLQWKRHGKSVRAALLRRRVKML
jgi:hypothetical protein